MGLQQLARKLLGVEADMVDPDEITAVTAKVRALPSSLSVFLPYDCSIKLAHGALLQLHRKITALKEEARASESSGGPIKLSVGQVSETGEVKG